MALQAVGRDPPMRYLAGPEPWAVLLIFDGLEGSHSNRAVGGLKGHESYSPGVACGSAVFLRPEGHAPKGLQSSAQDFQPWDGPRRATNNAEVGYGGTSHLCTVIGATIGALFINSSGTLSPFTFRAKHYFEFPRVKTRLKPWTEFCSPFSGHTLRVAGKPRICPFRGEQFHFIITLTSKN